METLPSCTRSATFARALRDRLHLFGWDGNLTMAHEARSLCFKLTSFRHFSQMICPLEEMGPKKIMSQDVSRNSQLTTSKKKPDQAQCLLAKAFCFTTLRARNIASIHLVKFLCAIPKVTHVIGSMPQQAIVSSKSPGRAGAAQQQYAAQHQRQRCHRCPWEWARHENHNTTRLKSSHKAGNLERIWKHCNRYLCVGQIQLWSKSLPFENKQKKKQIKNLTFEKKAKKMKKKKKQRKMHWWNQTLVKKLCFCCFFAFFQLLFFWIIPRGWHTIDCALICKLRSMNLVVVW